MKFQLKEAKNLPNKLFLQIEASFFLAKVTNGDTDHRVHLILDYIDDDHQQQQNTTTKTSIKNNFKQEKKSEQKSTLQKLLDKFNRM